MPLSALGACMVLLIPFLQPRFSNWAAVRTPGEDFAALGGKPVADFHMRSAAAPETPVLAARGAVFILDQSKVDCYWGTHLGGDSFTGTLMSVTFPLTADFLYIPIIGYPSSPGNALTLEIMDDTQMPQVTITYAGPNPQETPDVWEVETRHWRGRAARLVLHDTLSGPGGWHGVGAPVTAPLAGHAPTCQRERVTTNHGTFLMATAVVLVLLILPGAIVCTVRPHSLWSQPAFLPLPGLLMLVAYGVALWLLRAGANVAAARAYLILHGMAALWLFVRKLTSCAPARNSAQEAANSGYFWPFGMWGAVVVATLACGLNPLPIADEYHRYSTLPGRMVASPPDHIIPYTTGVYFYHGKDGRRDASAYFGAWSITSRGPLVPFALTALLNIFGEHPGDPPGPGSQPWPVAADGAYLARILGWLTNALVLLASTRLLCVLGASPATTRYALAWLALAPVTLINTLFLWPKLLATAFVLLAAADVLEGRHARGGVWAALAWLSHPVGALLLPSVALLGVHYHWQHAPESGITGAWRFRTAMWSVACFSGVVLAIMSPWLGFKLYLHQRDLFTRYPLGDGNGFTRAVSLASWLRARWDNMWLTLVPLGFFWSNRMSLWLSGPLHEPLRWTIQYAKTLPGHLGFACFGSAYLALLSRHCRRGDVGLVRLYLVFGAFVVMLLYWGYSSDGFGRNCLEPLSITLLIVTAAGWATAPRWMPWALGGLWCEGRWIELSGFIAAPSFRWTQVTVDVWVAWAASALTTAIVLVWAWRITPMPSTSP